MDIFTKRFKQVIESSNLNGARISELLGIHPPTLSKYIHGKSGMSTETLAKVCKTFNVSADWLLGLSDKRDLE